MNIYDYPSDAASKRIEHISSRSLDFDTKIIKSVEAILHDVKNNGDKAVIKYARRFDSPKLSIESMKVKEEEFTSAYDMVSFGFINALGRAARQIKSFHAQQVQKSWIDTKRPGTILGQIYNPVDTAGVYVPGGQGGKTPLVSTVLMNVIPAKIAGVRKVIMTTPAAPDGSVSPHMLVAAKEVGLDAVYKIGSAWAIGAMAYGTQSICPCDVIVGPGNIYVTTAKKIVSGSVGIDILAGPSEILIIGDDSANPEFIAADLLSQAEHDPVASAILVTDSPHLAQKVKDALNIQMEKLTRKETAEKSISDFGAIFKVADIDAAMDLANMIGPEHLEIQTKEPFELLGKVRNAGAVFLGPYTPEPVGDYMAGPNHVLPTSGTARFSSALSVDVFIKKTSVLHYSKTAFENEAMDIIRLANTEGLDAHARSVKIRLEK